MNLTIRKNIAEMIIVLMNVKIISVTVAYHDKLSILLGLALETKILYIKVYYFSLEFVISFIYYMHFLNFKLHIL